MKTNQFLILFIFILLLGLNSCVDEVFLEGNNDPQTEIRKASGFEEIASSGDFMVRVQSGDHYSVEVRAESNLLSYIETDVVGNTLKIRTRGVHNLVENYPMEVFITTPTLKGLSLSGSGKIKTDRFISDEFQVALSGSGDIDTKVTADRMKVNVTGSGSIILEGDASAGEFVISGSGTIRSYDFEQLICEAVISGSGNMYVNTSERIDARISGSGTVFYINYPVVHTSISGSGRVVNDN
ncbi:MAG TPA: head GIN domain-containing protein [Prolixibacteraceae bacterium]|jgi:hypothetical protein